ncbi:zf-HC2 domain-containing protein [Asanoa sp. NPDC049518]|uniref:zf-HC2 domain-containing protein n=1 Tax=unclassified Asanoa TaxID=2685164 RepID=UPI003446A72C
MNHPVDQLPAYAAGTLPPPQAAEIADHLRGCPSCRTDATSWSRLATGVRTATLTATPQDPPPFAAVSARLSSVTSPSEAAESVLEVSASRWSGASAGAVPRCVPAAARAGRSVASVRIAWGLLARQVRLIGWRVWAIALVVIAAAAGYAASAPPGRAGDLLALVVPLVAAVSVAAACSADGEAAELVRATPTSTRVLVLARLTLVLAVTVGIGTAASIGIALPRGDLVLTELFLNWFGPLVPLSAMSFALAVLWRYEAGITVVMACWVLRLLAPTSILDHGVAPILDALWRPSLPLLLGAVAVALAAVAFAPLAGRHHKIPAVLS